MNATQGVQRKVSLLLPITVDAKPRFLIFYSGFSRNVFGMFRGN